MQLLILLILILIVLMPTLLLIRMAMIWEQTENLKGGDLNENRR